MKVLSKLADKLADRVAKHFGFVRKSSVDDYLNWGYNISKRIDEHREDFETVSANSDLMTQPEFEYLIGHYATQDDYLLKVYFFIYGAFPPSKVDSCLHGSIRARPVEFGQITLSEYDESLEMKW